MNAKEKRSETVTVRMPLSMLKRIDALAERNRRKRNDFLNLLIEAAIERCEKNPHGQSF